MTFLLKVDERLGHEAGVGVIRRRGSKRAWGRELLARCDPSTPVSQRAVSPFSVRGIRFVASSCLGTEEMEVHRPLAHFLHGFPDDVATVEQLIRGDLSGKRNLNEKRWFAARVFKPTVHDRVVR